MGPSITLPLLALCWWLQWSTCCSLSFAASYERTVRLGTVQKYDALWSKERPPRRDELPIGVGALRHRTGENDTSESTIKGIPWRLVATTAFLNRTLPLGLPTSDQPWSWRGTASRREDGVSCGRRQES